MTRTGRHGVERQALDPGHGRTDRVHEPHRPRGADHSDPITGPQLAGRGDACVGITGVVSGRADVADEVVVHATDVDLHPAPERASVRDDGHDAAASELGAEGLDFVRVRPGVHDVVV